MIFHKYGARKHDINGMVNMWSGQKLADKGIYSARSSSYNSLLYLTITINVLKQS